VSSSPTCDTIDHSQLNTSFKHGKTRLSGIIKLDYQEGESMAPFTQWLITGFFSKQKSEVSEPYFNAKTFPYTV